MIRSNIFILFMLFLMPSVHGQDGGEDDKEKVEITSKSAKPDAGFIGLETSLLDLDLSSFNSRMGSGFELNGKYGGFTARGGFDIAYWNRFASRERRDETHSVYKPQMSRQWYALAGYALFEQEKEKEIHFNLDSEKEGRVRTVYYTEAKGPTAILYNLEAGVHSGFTQYRLKDLDVRGVMVNDDQNDEVMKLEAKGDNEERGFSTYLNYTYMSIGASRMHHTNMTIDAKGYGERSNKSFSRIYAHLLLGLQNELEDIYFSDQDQFSDGLNNRYSIDGHIDKMNTGFKLGYEIKNLDGFSLAGWTFEIGTFPGRGDLSHNFFFRFIWDITFYQPIE